MPYAAEIQAKLGVDTTSVGTDLAGAKNAFTKWGNDVAKEGTKTGTSYGGKLTEGIGKKLIGSQALGGALVASLGLSVTKIADMIASAIVGGNAEGWAEAGKIADENAKLIGEKFREAMSPKQLAADLEKELKRAVDALNAIKPDKKVTFADDYGNVSTSEELTAEQLTAQQAAQKKILEIEKQIRDAKKETAKDEKEYTDARKKADIEELSDGHKVEELQKQILETFNETQKGDLAAGELAKKKIHLLDLEREMRLTIKKIGEEDAKLIQKADDDEIAKAKQKLALAEKQHNVAKAKEKVAEDTAKVSDQGKLTVGELASLQGKGDSNRFKSSDQLLKERQFGSDEGLDANALEAKRKAQQILDLEKEAEQKRLAGDQTGFKSAFDRAGALTSELVGSGKLKSSESDKFGELLKQIKEDGIALQKAVAELIVVEKGKFVSQ